MFMFLFQLTINLISPSKVVKERESEFGTKIFFLGISGPEVLFFSETCWKTFFEIYLLKFLTENGSNIFLESLTVVAVDQVFAGDCQIAFLVDTPSTVKDPTPESECEFDIKFMFQLTDKSHNTVSQYLARIFQGFWCNLN